jgi:integrase
VPSAAKPANDNFASKANIGVPASFLEEIERMKKRRHQSPKPQLMGNYYYVRPWSNTPGRDRKRECIKLAPKGTPYREVLKISEEKLYEFNHEPIRTSSGLTLNDYMKDTYIPDVLALRPKGVRITYAGMLRKHVVPVFGNKTLHDMNPLSVQRFFSQMPARGINYPSIVKIYDALSHLLRSALRFKEISTNPLEDVELPRDERGEIDKPVITPVECELLLHAIPEPYSTMLFTSLWAGVRVSELCALRWKCIQGNSISIKQRYSRGEFGPTKTKASAKPVAVEPFVIQRIFALKNLTVRVPAGNAVREYKVVKRDAPDDFVFQSLTSADKPMNAANVRRRIFQPAADKLGLKLDWRCLRRTYGTLGAASGADVKALQGLMRHSRISTTLDIYAQHVPQAQAQAAKQMREYYEQQLQEAGLVQHSPITVQ